MSTQTVLNNTFTEVERMIYCRKRIVDTLYDNDPDNYTNLTAVDIKSISLHESEVCCQMEDCMVFIGKSKLIQNFWEHRTRTPSFFEYKIWKKYVTSDGKIGVPVGAIDYSFDSIVGALETKSGKIPQVATDQDGVQKIYFVNEEKQSCTCGSWHQLNEHRESFEKEFDTYSDIKFVPMCKHLRWFNADIKLKGLKFIAQAKEGKFNPHICVYQYDHKARTLKYKITNDGVRTNAQWLPMSGWKEKRLYDSSGMPTGECWRTLESALSANPSYKLVPFSASLHSTMSRVGSR